jgi:hypothetical protein
MVERTISSPKKKIHPKKSPEFKPSPQELFFLGFVLVVVFFSSLWISLRLNWAGPWLQSANTQILAGE